MKNTPYVNEVSSDEALLKRYRKEIMDLKKQLEEVRGRPGGPSPFLRAGVRWGDWQEGAGLS